MFKFVEKKIGTLNLTYDKRDQLKSVAYSGDLGLETLLDRTLTFDRSGNRTNDSISGEGQFIRNAIVEDQNFRYYSDTNGFGNIVQRTNKSTGEQQVYDYWSDGRIRKLTKYENVPTSTKTLEVEYYFDALGRRIAKKVKSRSREFTQTYSYLANQDKILFAKSGDNKVQMQVDGQGIDEHWAHITSSGIKTYISDHLGTVVNSEVTDENKITGAFGETLQDSPNFEYTSNPVVYGFTGRQFEPESGLYYYRNRSYDPIAGRFMTKDPLGIQGGGDTNLYRYVKNKPFSLVDPYGENPALILLGPALVYEAAFDATTFIYETTVNDRSLSDAARITRERSPLNNLVNTGQGVLFGSVASPFQALSNPDTFNAAKQLKEREGKIDQQINEQVGEGQTDTREEQCP